MNKQDILSLETCRKDLYRELERCSSDTRKEKILRELKVIKEYSDRINECKLFVETWLGKGNHG